jgi:hypothetical protein
MENTHCKFEVTESLRQVTHNSVIKNKFYLPEKLVIHQVLASKINNNMHELKMQQDFVLYGRLVFLSISLNTVLTHPLCFNTIIFRG